MTKDSFFVKFVILKDGCAAWFEIKEYVGSVELDPLNNVFDKSTFRDGSKMPIYINDLALYSL